MLTILATLNNNATQKERITAEYYRHVRLILNTVLCRITNINTIAGLVINYSYDDLNWMLNELQRLER